METEDQQVIIFTSIVGQCYALMDWKDKKYISIELKSYLTFSKACNMGSNLPNLKKKTERNLRQD